LVPQEPYSKCCCGLDMHRASVDVYVLVETPN